MARVVVGGTFDFFHKGHRELLLRAIRAGDEIMVGITSDRMAEKSRGYKVKPYEERKRAVEGFLKEAGANYNVVEILDPCGKNEEFGSAAEEAYDVIIVSPETFQMAEKINAVRKNKDLPPIEVVMIHCILADDNKPISSHRIRRGVIDEEGRVND